MYFSIVLLLKLNPYYSKYITSYLKCIEFVSSRYKKDVITCTIKTDTVYLIKTITNQYSQ